MNDPRVFDNESICEAEQELIKALKLSLNASMRRMEIAKAHNDERCYKDALANSKRTEIELANALDNHDHRKDKKRTKVIGQRGFNG